MSLVEKSLPLAAMKKSVEKVMPVLRAKGIDPDSKNAFEYTSYLLDAAYHDVTQAKKSLKRWMVFAIVLLICCAISLAAFFTTYSNSNMDPSSPSSVYAIVPQERNYVASVNSDKYHRMTCNYADFILEENRVYFETEAEAVEAGKTPCSVCKP